MSEKIFNSRDPKYKSKYGALEAKSPVVFRLLLPCTPGIAARNARMLILSDFEKTEREVTLRQTSENEGASCYWEVVYTTERPGLYWYYFQYDTEDGRTERIYKGAYGTGYTGIDECRWQLTVFENVLPAATGFKGGIMYQIFPDRFYSSGKDKDLVPKDRVMKSWTDTPEWAPDKDGKIKNNDYFGGDLLGITEKIPYLKSLGVTILYLNPIFEAHSNHRYNTADYTKIDPLLGTEDDFVNLCKSAHNLGIKVILDGVFSHTGDDSIYFNKYRRYDSLGAYNSEESEYFKWYKFNKWPDNYTSWWGIDTLPEVIEETTEYLDYITGPDGIIEKWLRLGADGFRLDVADELPDEFIEAARARISEVKPGAILLGEVWEDASNKTAYSIRRKYLLGRELHSVMNYPFKEAIIDFLINDDAENFLEKILTITENYPKDVLNALMNPLSTHDTVRILTILSGENCEGEGKDRLWQSKYAPTPEQRARAKRLLSIATAIQYTLPGFPSIYYGDEIGMEGCKDPFNRAPYPWDACFANGELLNFQRSIGKLRTDNTLLADARFVPISGAQGCVAYARTKGGESIILVASIATEPITYTLPPEYKGGKIIMGNGALSDLSLHMGAESFVILKHKI